MSRVKRGGCLLQEITRRTREACFLHPHFKQPYSCRNSSSILVLSRGFNLHSGPVTCFANQFLSPLCGGLSVLLYSIKFIRMERLVLLICIQNPREARVQEGVKPFAGRQVDLRELEWMYCIFLKAPACPLLICDSWSQICIIYVLHYFSKKRQTEFALNCYQQCWLRVNLFPSDTGIMHVAKRNL